MIIDWKAGAIIAILFILLYLVIRVKGLCFCVCDLYLWDMDREIL